MTIFYNVLPFPTPPGIATILDDSPPDIDMLLWIEARKMDEPSRFTAFARERTVVIFNDHVNDVDTIVGLLPFDDTGLCVQILTGLELRDAPGIVISSMARLSDGGPIEHRYLEVTQAQLDDLLFALRRPSTSYHAFMFMLRHHERHIITKVNSLRILMQLFEHNRNSRLEERMTMIIARTSVRCDESLSIALNQALETVLATPIL